MPGGVAHAPHALCHSSQCVNLSTLMVTEWEYNEEWINYDSGFHLVNIIIRRISIIDRRGYIEPGFIVSPMKRRGTH